MGQKIAERLTPGTRVVTSPLRNPVKGTKVGIVQAPRLELESSP